MAVSVRRFTETGSGPPANDLRWCADGDAAGRDRAGDDGAGTDDGAGSDDDSGGDKDISSDPHIILNRNGFRKGPLFVNRKHGVREHMIGCNNHGVRGNADSVPDADGAAPRSSDDDRVVLD